MKRIISMLLALTMILSTMSVIAAPDVYTPGDMTYSLDLNRLISLDGATIEENSLVIKAGGKASFDIFFDFDVAKVDVGYSTGSAGKLNITMEDNSYDIPVTAEATTATANVIDRRGAHVLTISSDCDVTISSVVFTKVSVKIGVLNNLQVKLDDYDEALLTSIVVNPDRVALKVNGAFRYVDYDDTSKTPLLIDGRIYLPIHTAARAFSIYYEDYADLNYVYMMDDNFEIYSSEKGTFYTVNGKTMDIGKFAIYIDGTTYVPFRQLAEITGRTVEWKDGYAIADDRIHAKNIIESESIFARLAAEFDQFDKALVSRNKTYYVSQADYAKDTNDGSENFPFRTIQKAADVAMAGDTVIIGGGTYREEVVVKNDGTATQPIIFKAKDGEEVIISAFEKISGFEPYKDGIYQTIIPDSLGYDRNFIIKDDEIIREGRHPNTDTSTVHSPHPGYDKVNIMRATMGDMRIPQEDKFAAYSDIDLDQDEKDYWKGGTFITLSGEAWTLTYGMITASEKGKIQLSDHPNNNSYGLTKYYNQKCDDDYGYITHHINTVDMPGEWYIDDSTNILYIIPPEGTDPNTLELELKQRQRVVDMTDRKFVQFHNINTRGGGLTMAGNTEMNVLNGGEHKYIAQVDWSNTPSLHSCRFYNPGNTWTTKVDAPELGEVGFFCHGYNNAFVNTHIAYSSNAGIYTTGTYTYIDNNLIEHTGYMGTYPAGVTLEGVKWDTIDAKYGGHTVVGNSITGAGRANLYMSRNYSAPGTTNPVLPYLPCDFSFNHIWMGSTVARDTGNIYMYGITPGYDRKLTDMHHNITYDIATSARNSYMAANYYHDGHSSLVQTRSNVSFATREGHIISDFYQHTNGDYINYIEKWGNTTPGIVPEGIKGLNINDYPYGKPFDVGSTLENEERFMKNYDRLNTEFITLADEAVLEGGATLAEDGFVDMPTADASITFPDVKLGEKGSELTLFYASDIYKFSKDATPNFTIEFIKDGEVVTTRYESAAMHIVKIDDLARLVMYLPGELSGTYDIRVKVTEDYIRPCKLMVADCDYLTEAANSSYPLDGDMIQLGTWDNCLDCGGVGPRTNFKTEELNVLNKTNMTISESNQHKLVYNNRHITKDATKMTMRLGSSWEYSNSYVDVYVDSIYGTPIATFDLHDYIPPGGGHGWTTVYVTVDLAKTLTAGEYDFYVVFRGHANDDPSITTEFGVADAHWISFHNGETYQGSTPLPTLETTAE